MPSVNWCHACLSQSHTLFSISISLDLSVFDYSLHFYSAAVASELNWEAKVFLKSYFDGCTSTYSRCRIWQTLGFTTWAPWFPQWNWDTLHKSKQSGICISWQPTVKLNTAVIWDRRIVKWVTGSLLIFDYFNNANLIMWIIPWMFPNTDTLGKISVCRYHHHQLLWRRCRQGHARCHFINHPSTFNVSLLL